MRFVTSSTIAVAFTGVFVVSLVSVTSKSHSQEICKDTYVVKEVNAIKQSDVYVSCKMKTALNEYGAEIEDFIRLSKLLLPVFQSNAPQYAESDTEGGSSEFDGDVQKLGIYYGNIDDLDWSKYRENPTSDSEVAELEEIEGRIATVVSKSSRLESRVFSKIAHVDMADLGTANRISFCKARLAWRKTRTMSQKIADCLENN